MAVAFFIISVDFAGRVKSSNFAEEMMLAANPKFGRHRFPQCKKFADNDGTV